MSILINKFTPTDPRLGRHIEHDTRSRNFPITASAPAKPKTVFWPTVPNVLDQKHLGACVGFTGADILDTDLFKPVRKKLNRGRAYTSRDGVKFYHLATMNDNIAGTYPPDDTGSSGLGLAKALQKLKIIDKYSNVFSYAELLAAIEVSPIAVGVVWTQQMFQPNADGVVTVGVVDNTTIAGGHEFSLRGHDVDQGLWLARNHWGNAWSPNTNGQKLPGEFWLPDADIQILLSSENQGDAMVLHGSGLK